MNFAKGAIISLRSLTPETQQTGLVRPLILISKPPTTEHQFRRTPFGPVE
jgi:hypothetical protein